MKNGKIAKISDFPFSVQIYDFNSEFKCFGSLITRKHILTLRICYVNPVYINILHSNQNSQWYRIDDVKYIKLDRNPITNKESEYDLAILVVRANANFFIKFLF